MALKNEPHIQRVWLPHEDAPGLAMSRAFGDFLLKDYGIIAIPDVSFHRLTSNNQFLVLATDGVRQLLVTYLKKKKNVYLIEQFYLMNFD